MADDRHPFGKTSCAAMLLCLSSCAGSGADDEFEADDGLAEASDAELEREPTTTRRDAALVMPHVYEGRRVLTRRSPSSSGHPGSIVMVDEDGHEIHPQTHVLDYRLRQTLDSLGTGAHETITVRLRLRSDAGFTTEIAPSVGAIEQREDGTTITLGGVRVTADALDEEVQRLQGEVHHNRARRRDQSTRAMDELIARMGWEDDPRVIDTAERGLRDFTMALEPDEIRRLGEQTDLLHSVHEVLAPTPATLQDALDATAMATFAHGYGHTGAGIGIHHDEGACGTQYLDNPNYRCLQPGYPEPGDPPRTDGHATAVASQLIGTAPDATIYNREVALIDPSDPDPTTEGEPEAYIQSMSYTFGHYDGAYTSADRTWGQNVLDQRIAHFVAAGNYGEGAGWVSTPGRAWNVITVGAAQVDYDFVHAYSSWKDPINGPRKPEIVAPDYIGGTSISAPFAAGFAASLMGANEWLKYRPHLLKAVLMASAHHDIEGDRRFGDHDGAGGIDFFDAHFYGMRRWWESESNAAFFSADETITFTEDVVAGQRYRLAMVWLVDEDWAYTNGQPNMDLDLSVTFDGKLVGASRSRIDAFELVEFESQHTGPHTVTIERAWNSGIGPVLIGYSMDHTTDTTNGYFDLDGTTIGENTTDMVTLDEAAFDGLGDFTMSCEVAIDEVQDVGYYPANTLLSCANTTFDNELRVWFEANTHSFRVGLHNHTSVFPLDPAQEALLTDGERHQWSLSRSGSQMTASIDGVSLGVRSTPLNQLDAEVCVLGQEQDCVGGCFSANQSLAGTLGNCTLIR